MGVIRYGRTAQIGVYPGNQSGRYISYRSGGKKFPLDPDTQVAWRFAQDKSLTDSVRGLTLDFVRASPATYYDAAGNLQTALANEPRFDHDPVTKESLGLLIEESGANLFLQSDAPATQDIATTAQDYTISVWGTGDITVSGSATGVATEGNPLTVTATAGTLTCTVNGSLDRAQVEAGAFPTSYIPTTIVSVTREQDSCSTTDLTWYNQPEGTFYAAVSSLIDSFEGRQGVWGLRQSGSINQQTTRESITAMRYRFDGSATAVNLPTTADFTNGKVVKHAGAYADADQIAATGGALSGPGTVTPVTMTPIEIRVGADPLGNLPTPNSPLNGHIREFGYANVRKDNQFLENLTTP